MSDEIPVVFIVLTATTDEASILGVFWTREDAESHVAGRTDGYCPRTTQIIGCIVK